MKVLSIEPDATTASDLGSMLVRHNHEFINVTSAEEALHTARRAPADIILENYKLEGDEFISALRMKACVETPLIVLGPRGWEPVIECLDKGADDYLARPFHLYELLVRMVAVTRRGRPRLQPIDVGPLRYNPELSTFSIDAVVLHFTRVEYHMLVHLVLHAGQVVSHLDLHRSYAEDDNRRTNVVEVMVSKIRKRLDPVLATGALKLETIRGVGYRLSAP